MSGLATIMVGVIAILGITAVSLLVGYPVKWTWNHVMPHLFGFPQIDFWQAFCLYWISNALLRSMQTNNNSSS